MFRCLDGLVSLFPESYGQERALGWGPADKNKQTKTWFGLAYTCYSLSLQLIMEQVGGKPPTPGFSLRRKIGCICPILRLFWVACLKVWFLSQPRQSTDRAQHILSAWRLLRTKRLGGLWQSRESAVLYIDTRGRKRSWDPGKRTLQAPVIVNLGAQI